MAPFETKTRVSRQCHRQDQKRVLLSAGARCGAMGNLAACFANSVTVKTKSAICSPPGARCGAMGNLVACFANSVTK